jgi:hypothetical protein
MSKWDKQAVIAIVFGGEFFWIESRHIATQSDFYFTK